MTVPGAEPVATAIGRGGEWAYPQSGKGRALLELGRAAEAAAVLRRAVSEFEQSGVASAQDLASDPEAGGHVLARRPRSPIWVLLA